MRAAQRPPRLVHTRWLFWADGMAVSPRLVFVHPRARGNAALLAHEQVHCEQMRRIGTLRFLWLYLSSPRFRLLAEVEAYAVSLRFHPGNLNHYAQLLARRYWLRVPVAEAKRLLAEQADPGRTLV